MGGVVVREGSITEFSTTRFQQQLVARLAVTTALPCLAFGTTANNIAHYTGVTLAISLPKAAYNGWILPKPIGCAQIVKDTFLQICP